MSRKEKAMAFLKMTASGNVQMAYDQFVAPHFIHHNQYFKGDRQSLLDAMKEAARQNPNQSFEVKQILEDGDQVMVFSKVEMTNPQAPQIAVVHILRFENDKIVELWDLIQPIRNDSPNEHGVF